MTEEPQGVGERYARRIGEGAGYATTFGPLAYMTGPAALQVEAMSALGAPIVGQTLEEAGGGGLVQAGGEMIAGITPAGVAKSMASRTAREAAGVAARGAGHASGPLAGTSRRAAERFQRTVGDPSTQSELLDAIEQAKSVAGEGATLPTTAQIGAAAEVPGSSLATMSRALESGDQGVNAAIGARVKAARESAEGVIHESQPAGRGMDVPTRFGESADVGREAWREAYGAVPGGVLGNADMITQWVSRLKGTKKRVLEREFKNELSDLQALYDDFPDGIVPIEELDAIASQIKAKLRDPTATSAHKFGGELLDAVEDQIDAGEALTSARGARREFADVYEPRAPKRTSAKGTKVEERLRHETAQALQKNTNLVNSLLTAGDPVKVARQTKRALGDNAQGMEDLHAAFWEHIYGEGLTKTPEAMRKAMSNPRLKAAYVELWGEGAWQRNKDLGLLYRASKWGNWGTAAVAQQTNSNALAMLAGEMASSVGTGSPQKLQMLGKIAKRMGSFFGDSASTRLYRQAIVDPELGAAFLRVNLTPEAWAEGVRRVAVRRGIQIGLEE
jgi:hypothetical protein